MNKREILNEVIDLALEVEEMGHSLFVDYSPHVQQVSIRLHVGGWKKNNYPQLSLSIYFTSTGYDPEYSVMAPEERLTQVRKKIMEACNVELAHE